ncbi:GtrA family protein [Defluviimonas sp. WL0050]|uniref:GtrA family protein n=1 Tax=Albidovulum litorale TaxID=2984134 RepID=A0ABT2ZHU8_9RHOB|nr:GtrA family protein [Defluviimonas sp. WL0050]MCV2870696.1 GtrA family protein [Defluviimonas sp. WL0050]
MILALQERPGLWRFVKFLFVGVVNTAFGWVIYALLLRIGGLPWQLSLALAYVIGVMWNFITHARIVFKTKGFGRLPAYILAYVAAFALNKWVLSLLIAAGLSELWSQALLLPPMAIVTFFLISYVLTDEIPLVTGRRGRGS